MIGQSEAGQNLLEKNQQGRLRRTQKTLIGYESNKSGKRHTFLVSFIICLSWPE